MKDKKIHSTFTIRKSIIERMKVAAEKTRRSQSAYVDVAIEEKLEGKNKGHGTYYWKEEKRTPNNVN